MAKKDGFFISEFIKILGRPNVYATTLDRVIKTLPSNAPQTIIRKNFQGRDSKFISVELLQYLDEAMSFTDGERDRLLKELDYPYEKEGSDFFKEKSDEPTEQDQDLEPEREEEPIPMQVLDKSYSSTQEAKDDMDRLLKAHAVTELTTVAVLKNATDYIFSNAKKIQEENALLTMENKSLSGKTIEQEKTIISMQGQLDVKDTIIKEKEDMIAKTQERVEQQTENLRAAQLAMEIAAEEHKTLEKKEEELSKLNDSYKTLESQKADSDREVEEAKNTLKQQEEAVATASIWKLLKMKKEFKQKNRLEDD